MTNDSNYLVQYEAARSLITLGKPHKQYLWWALINDNVVAMVMLIYGCMSLYCTGVWSKSLVDFITCSLANGIFTGRVIIML